MNKKTLAKKTFSCWGISRPGANMKALFDKAFDNADAKVTTAGENEYGLLHRHPRSMTSAELFIKMMISVILMTLLLRR